MTFAFFDIIFTGNSSTQICGTAKIECYMQAKQSLFEEDIVDGLSDEEARSFRQKCNCLPSCTKITYNVHIDRAKFYWREALLRTLSWTTEEVYRSIAFKISKILFQYSQLSECSVFYQYRFHMSSVIIYFDEYYMSTLRREEVRSDSI